MVEKLLVERLLFEAESSELDFKVQQYPFAGAMDDQKSEVLKDILAFANAWRRADAYVLVGIREVKGGRSEVVGVSHHIEDASLQQFVNAKTQRPVEFSYRPIEFEEKQIGLITIPLQERPVYLVKDFDRLQANTVYIRRGSSTDIARPEEIARMGALLSPTAHMSARLRPVLGLDRSDPKNPQFHTLRISVKNESTVVPREIRVDVRVPADFVLPNVLDNMAGPVRDGYKSASRDQGWFGSPLLKDDSQVLWRLMFSIPPGTSPADPRLQMKLGIIVNAEGMQPYRLEIPLAEALNYMDV